MTRVHLRLVAALIVLLSAIGFTADFTTAQRSGTDTYAITNARIVTVSGPVIERGTVVIRDGLIAAVGANAGVPADARVIDGNGLTIYPGLFDANTHLGLPAPSPSPSPGGGAGGFLATLIRPTGEPPGPNSTRPPGLQPETMAEQSVRPGGAQIEAARNAGVTTALTSPRTGIWMGQSALINLAGDTPQQMIVRSPVAMHVGFTPLRGTYPNSLLGVFATLRQMLLDAQQYREAQQVYHQSPRGIRRPSPDRSLEALLPVLDGRMPVVMYADREREIARALDLAEEFKLRVIIAGGSEAWKLAERLRRADATVLLSVNFPRRTSAAAAEADPEPLRVLRDRVEAPKTAGRLAGANVRFAFQSGGLSSFPDYIANVIKSTENGLSRENALRALTLWPAETFGVADRLGSIETGKIANLTVLRGDFFDRNRRVAHVFIDGRPVDLRTVPPLPSAGSASGTWTLNVDLAQGDISITLLLQQEGDRLSGSIQGPLGSAEIANASMGRAGELRFTAPVTLEEQTSEATFAGTIVGNEMKGVVNITGRTPGSFTGTRAPAPDQEPAATPTP